LWIVDGGLWIADSTHLLSGGHTGIPARNETAERETPEADSHDYSVRRSCHSRLYEEGNQNY